MARVPLQYEGVNSAITELAESITPEQREEMHRLQDIEPREMINASWDSDTGFIEEAGELTHLIGVLTTADAANCELTLVPAPAGDWAVFPCEGPFPETMQNATARIYGEWLASSGWQLRESLIFSFTRFDPSGPASHTAKSGSRWYERHSAGARPKARADTPGRSRPTYPPAR